METIVCLQEPKLQEKCLFSLEMTKGQKLEINFSGTRSFQGRPTLVHPSTNSKKATSQLESLTKVLKCNSLPKSYLH